MPAGRAAVHADAWQYGSGATQSASCWQEVRHDVPALLQARLPAQALAAGVAHAPFPSQYAVGVREVPLQLCARQVLEVPGNVHAVREAAVHAPAQAPLPPQAVRVPCGGPEVTAAQRPGVTSHASQVPEQAPSQQTPSTQYPELQAVEASHWPPKGFPPAPASAEDSPPEPPPRPAPAPPPAPPAAPPLPVVPAPPWPVPEPPLPPRPAPPL
jgi:hypothetical protein